MAEEERPKVGVDPGPAPPDSSLPKQFRASRKRRPQGLYGFGARTKTIDTGVFECLSSMYTVTTIRSSHA